MRWPFLSSSSRELVTVNPPATLPIEEIKLTFNQLIERMAMLQQSVSGISVSAESAMRCTAVLGVVRQFTNAISNYPVYVQRVTNEGTRVRKELLPNHAVAPLLRRPNGVHTSAQFFSQAITHANIHGNFYALKGQGATGPIRFLRPIENPDAVTLDSINWAQGAIFRVNLDGETLYVPQRKLLHFTNGILSSDGVTGVSLVDRLREPIAISLAAERLLANLYGNNDVPPFALTTDSGFANKEQFEKWMQAFKESREKARESGTGTLMLPPGMSIKELSFKPIDALLIDVIKQKAREIFAGFGVPPHKVADLERATFSNIEELDLEFVRDSMGPHCVRFSQAMSRDLLTDADVRGGVRIYFDTAQATEGKFADRMAAYARGYSVGVYSANDIRAKLGENPREGGDDYREPLNMESTDDEQDPDGDPARNEGTSDGRTTADGGTQE